MDRVRLAAGAGPTPGTWRPLSSMSDLPCLVPRRSNPRRAARRWMAKSPQRRARRWRSPPTPPSP
eukprot:5884518-Pyramimonas_sp.AAC.1